MRIGKIEIPQNAFFEFYGSAWGMDLRRIARLYVRFKGFRKVFHITRIDSGLEENELSGLLCKISLIESGNGNGTLCAIITEGKLRDQMFFFEVEVEST